MGTEIDEVDYIRDFQETWRLNQIAVSYPLIYSTIPHAALLKIKSNVFLRALEHREEEKHKWHRHNTDRVIQYLPRIIVSFLVILILSFMLSMH